MAPASRRGIVPQPCLLESLIAAAHEYRKSNFDAFAARIRVCGPAVVATTYFIFNSSVVAEVSRSDHGHPLIRWGGIWRTFDEFCQVALLGPSFKAPTGRQGYDTLQRWYRYRDEPFRFMELPTELRLEIIEHAVDDDIYPMVVPPVHPVGVPAVSLGKGWKPIAPSRRLEGTHDPADVVAPPRTATSPMNVSKQVRAGLLSVLRASSRQCFDDPAQLRKFPPLFRHGVLQAKDLSHVALNFDNKSYLEFFGVEAYPYGGNSQVLVLGRSSLPFLERLDIILRSSCWEPLTHPWWALSRQRGNGHDSWRRRCACQKVLTEMILTFALNQVKHIPTVTVEGYCKNATKKAFAAAHKKLRNDPTTWPAEWTMMTEDIRKWPAGDLPPHCHCTPKCGFWGVEAVMDPQRPYVSPHEIFAKYRFNKD